MPTNMRKRNENSIPKDEAPNRQRKSPRHHDIPAAIRYDTSAGGIGNSGQVANAISEIYAKIASGKIELAPSTQASLMLNAIGKRLALENLKVRVGIRSVPNRNGFFLA